VYDARAGKWEDRAVALKGEAVRTAVMKALGQIVPKAEAKLGLP